MFMKCSVVLFLLTLCGGYLAVSEAEDKQCKQNWTYYNESCYFYVPNITSWKKSQIACVSEQANLVTVNDQYEMDFLITLMKTKGSWSGLYNNSDGNVFEWISGEKSDYRYWKTDDDEPRISKSKRCVHMYQKHEHKWHMAACGNKQRYTCEKAWKPCDSKPCQNGGTCVPNGNNYTCQCMAGYTGLQCEQGITATSTAVNVVIATSRPMEALSNTEVAMSTPGIPEVTQSSTVFPAQSHSVVISPSTSKEPATSSSLEGPKIVPPCYTKPEMTTAYTQPERTTSPPKTDLSSNSGKGGQTDARKQPQSDGINVAAIVVPVVLILLLILLVIIGYICYERNKKQKKKEDETVDMCLRASPDIIWL